MIVDYKDNDIIVLPNNTHIENSFQTHSIKDMKDTIK